MKKLFVIVTIVAAFAALLAISWNIVIVVETHQEEGYYADTHDIHNDTKTGKWYQYKRESQPGWGGTPTITRTVVIKQRLITGETWKEYVD